MLNSYYIGGNTNNQKCVVKLNTPSSGFIQKSNPMSRFIRFQRGSEIEDLLFPTEPYDKPHLKQKFTRYNNGRIYEDEEIVEVVVLQVCIFGNDYMLAEYVIKSDIDD